MPPVWGTLEPVYSSLSGKKSYSLPRLGRDAASGAALIATGSPTVMLPEPKRFRAGRRVI